MYLNSNNDMHVTMKFVMRKETLLILVLLACFGNVSSQPDDGHLTVMTYNIWNGYDWGNDETRRAEVTEWIKQQEPDIIALQELCKYTSEKLEEDAHVWGHPYSVLLKTTGYSVGVTSRYPIVVRDKIRDGMHHGALHCLINGIDVFVIHFHPGEIAFRRKEAVIILDKLSRVREKNHFYLVLGDFNSVSPFDADLYDPAGSLMTRLKERYPDPAIEKGNISYGDLDYSVMSSLLAFPLMDVCRPFTRGMGERGSFPGRILGRVNHESDEQLVSRLERIDFILASPHLSVKCTGARVCNGPENYYLSDHYPVIAEFDLSGK
jgi:endonuclease/exonuclease/phosphatase family metal-dependent hydrolase